MHLEAARLVELKVPLGGLLLHFPHKEQVVQLVPLPLRQVPLLALLAHTVHPRPQQHVVPHLRRHPLIINTCILVCHTGQKGQVPLLALLAHAVHPRCQQHVVIQVVVDTVVVYAALHLQAHFSVYLLVQSSIDSDRSRSTSAACLCMRAQSHSNNSSNPARYSVGAGMQNCRP